MDTPRPIDAAGETILSTASGSTIAVALSDLDNANFGAGKGLYGAGYNPLQNEVTIRWKMKGTCDLTDGSKLSIETFAESGCGASASGNGEIANSSNLDVANATSPCTIIFMR